MGKIRPGDPSINENLDMNRPANVMPEGLDTPQGREAYARQQEAKAAQATASVGEVQDFNPRPGTGTELIYLRNNRKQAIHITTPDPANPGGDLFIPGKGQYMMDGEPYLIIERGVLNRSPALRRLLREPVGTGPSGQPIEQIIEHPEEQHVIKTDPNGVEYTDVQIVVKKERKVLYALEEISESEYYEEIQEYKDWSAGMMEQFSDKVLKGQSAEGAREQDEFQPVKNWQAIEGGRVVT